MGYTHYWSNARDLTDSEWDAIKAAASRIINTARNCYFITLAREFDDASNKPEITDEYIRFNGVGDDGHETFYLSREATDFQFCKTARKDYDAPAAAILIAAKVYAPDAFSWRSDGYGIDARDPSGETVYNDHGDAVKLYNEANGASLADTNADLE